VNTHEESWFVYLLECRDGSLYCGIAKDVIKRLEMHESGKGARFTRGRRPLKLVWQTEDPISHGAALKLERRIKSMPRKEKLALVEKPE
jgi:putative endonuclease